MIVTTLNDLPGNRVPKVIGVARGLTVRSRSALGNIGAIFLDSQSVYTNLVEAARQEHSDTLVSHASEMGGNAIIAMRYDANEIIDGITEVLAYATAVTVQAV